MDWVAVLLKLSHVVLAMLLAAAVTPALRAAFADARVRAARLFEIGGIAVIVALMVLKPF